MFPRHCIYKSRPFGRLFPQLYTKHEVVFLGVERISADKTPMLEERTKDELIPVEKKPTEQVSGLLAPVSLDGRVAINKVPITQLHERGWLFFRVAGKTQRTQRVHSIDAKNPVSISETADTLSAFYPN